MNRKIWVAAIGGLLAVGALSGCEDDAEVTAPETVAVEDEAAPTTEPEAATETPAPPTVEAVTETVTVEPEAATVTEEVTVEAPAPETEVTERSIGDMSDEEINELALQMIWDAMSASEQADICFGWGMDRDMMIDAFIEGAGGSYSRDFVSDFFDGEC